MKINIARFLLLCIVLVTRVAGQEEVREEEVAEPVQQNEPPPPPPNCDAICAERVEDAVTPLRQDLVRFREELDFVVKDRNELKAAHETVLQQRGELQTRVIQATERSDGLAVRVNELERDLQTTKEEMDTVKGQLAVALVELDAERSKIGFFGRLQEEIKTIYGSLTTFLVKLFKKKSDDEL